MGRDVNLSQCGGSYKPARQVRSLSHLGSKYFGKLAGQCCVCGGRVNVNRRNNTATAHPPRNGK
ncbi:hypothetical protein [Amycolatopsis sp. NPDC059021]|uniref:hypothetical protein n=1 Tax=Amycolatopsis sp. NPDC059021 TaxID=3346704 RepID=UPI00366D83B5